MSEMNPEDAQENWAAMMTEMNNAVANSFEQNMEAQAAFMESWMDAFEGSMPDEETANEGIEGYERAADVWMEAAEQMTTRLTAAAEGEDVEVQEFRDIWLQSANEAFSEVMSTTAFAAGTGQTVSQAMELQQQADDVAQDTLERMGFATREDVDEVGARLVELERRQHEVSAKLDRVLDAMED